MARQLALRASGAMRWAWVVGAISDINNYGRKACLCTWGARANSEPRLAAPGVRL